MHPYSEISESIGDTIFQAIIASPENIQQAAHEGMKNLRNLWTEFERTDVFARVKPERIRPHFETANAVLLANATKLPQDIAVRMTEKLKKCLKEVDMLDHEDHPGKRNQIIDRLETIVYHAIRDDLSVIPEMQDIHSPSDRIIYLSGIFQRMIVSMWSLGEKLAGLPTIAMRMAYIRELERSDDIATGIASIIPSEWERDNPVLSGVLDTKYCEVFESVRRMLFLIDTILPSQEVYQQLFEMGSRFFLSKGFVLSGSTLSSEQNDARMFKLIAEAEDLRSFVQSRPHTHIPPIDCTEVLREFAYESEAFSLENATIEHTESGDFFLIVQYARISGQTILNTVRFETGLSFQNTKKRIHAKFPRQFDFKNGEREIIRVWRPAQKIDIPLQRPRDPELMLTPADFSCEVASSVTVDLVLFRSLAKYLSRETVMSHGTPRTSPAPWHQASTLHRKPVKIVPSDPIYYDRLPPPPGSDESMMSETEIARRNFGRRSALVTLPEGYKPSKEAFERCVHTGIKLYAYILPRSTEGNAHPQDLLIPQDGLVFLISHLSYEDAIEQTKRLVNMYGWSKKVMARITTYRRETLATDEPSIGI